MNDDLELSRRLTAIVTMVEGVGDVYPSGTLAQAVTLTAVNAIADEDTDDAKVAVSLTASGGLSVTTTIGVANGYSARETLRTVSDALRAYLETARPNEPTPTIDVKVSRIETDIPVA